MITEIEQGIDKISEFLKELDHVVKYELLPYHPLGLKKAEALGVKQKEFTVPAKEFMKEIEKYAFLR